VGRSPVLVLTLTGLAVTPPPCRAAEAQPAAAGRELALSVGCGSSAMSVGDDTRRTFAPSLSARVGLDRRGRFALIAELQPAGVHSPVVDEAFAAANLLAGASLGRSPRLRLVAGVQLRWWSGPRRVEASDAGPVVGADLGYVYRLSDRITLAPELVWRGSVIEIEGNVRDSYAGVQLAIAWRR
jgi:hypothetical protein